MELASDSTLSLECVVMCVHQGCYIEKVAAMIVMILRIYCSCFS